MGKITFQNLPSTSTPLNATNLNNIQEIYDLAIKRTSFSMATNTSKTITHTVNNNLLYIFSAKGGLGSATEFWIIGTYGAGGSSRTQIDKLVSSTSEGRYLTVSITDNTITISNATTTTWYCSITPLVGDISAISVS